MCTVGFLEEFCCSLPIQNAKIEDAENICLVVFTFSGGNIADDSGILLKFKYVPVQTFWPYCAKSLLQIMNAFV